MILTDTFINYFNCDFLITESLDMPSAFCNGVDAEVFSLPGLKDVMNTPLNLIRFYILLVVLTSLVAASGCITYVINNLKKVVKLITFDKAEWQNLLSIRRIFITTLFLLTTIFIYLT